jgi:hypothetical protein
LKIYNKFDFHEKKDHYKFLVNYPKYIENYDVAGISEIYKRIESFSISMSERGFWISCINPINTGTILIPFAIATGITYINVYNLINREEDEVKDILSNEIIILDEVGVEGPKMRWLIDKFIQQRYNNGLTTFIGCYYPIRNIGNIYNFGLESKCSSMMDFEVEILNSSVIANINNSSELIITMVDHGC